MEDNNTQSSPLSSPYLIAVASGDGIGPEVCEQAVRVLKSIG
jgi:isocitrate/isopropylmalate dehydrogenase